MKKLILILSISLLTFFSVSAQFPMMGGGAGSAKVTGRIAATVIDSATKQPVEYATVSLVNIKDNKVASGGLTDSKGKVAIQNVATGEYKLIVGFIGYISKTVIVKTTPSKPDFNAGNIALAGGASNLKEVTIEGRKAVIENKIDRLVYNAEADGTSAGGDATDVMRKVPMLSVDADGNVQLRGSAVRVLINGKPSGTMASSVGDALKMIPADQIKNVEVITNPSAKYDAEGSGGIINIITKKSNAQGVSGSVNATAGTRQNTGGFNLTAKSGRFSANTSAWGMFAYPQDSRVVFFNGLPSGDVMQDGTTKWKRDLGNGSLGLDYDFNAYNNISTNAKFTSFYNGGPGSSLISTNGVATGLITSKSDVGNNNLDWNLDYRKTSKKQGEEFSVAAQLTQGRNTNDFVNDFRTGTGMPINYLESSNVGKNREYTLQSDYVLPLKKAMVFEVGAKGILRNIISEFSQNSAQNFDYDQNVAAAYTTLSFNLNKDYKFKGGLRGELTEIGFSDIAGNPVKNNYFNLFPSAILSRNFSASTSIKLAYNRRVQRPSLTYLNPFRNEANEFSVIQGNPNLDPEMSDNLEFAYSTYIKGSMINASVFYRKTNDIIESIISEDVISGKTLTTYGNVGNTQSFGANLFASYNPTKKWTLMTNLGANTYEVKARNLQGMNNGTYVNYNLFLRSATAFNKGWNLELYGVLVSPRYTFQSKTEAMTFYGGTVKKDIFNKQGSIGLNVVNPFARDLHIEVESKSGSTSQKNDIYYPIRSVGINFTYKFGKLKFTEKKKIQNDDVKQEQQQGGMGGMNQ